MNEDLDRYLDSLERSSKFNVIRTLKSTPLETTELVELADGVSMPGPYIRKRIELDAGIGQAYIRLFEEQQAGKRIPAAPFIFECFETEDSLNVVMEFVQGKTLADWVYEVDPSPAFAAYVFPKLCDAVSELHEGFAPPIIHRDLKPSNVMINDHGVKVIDFGIARTFREDAESDTRHFGTPSYAPPEQFGFGQTDERSDIYALGMLLYYCLTERTPTFSMLESEFEDDDVPVPLRAVIAKATSFDPANRYASVRELKQAFLRAIDETLALAPAATEQWAPPTGLPAVFAESWGPPGAAVVPATEGSTGGESESWGTPGEAMAPATEGSTGGESEGAPVGSTPHGPGTPTGSTDQGASASSNAGFPPQGVFPDDEFTPRKVRAPEILALFWNGAVFLLWLLMVAACSFAAFEPNESNALTPTWLLVLEYPVFMGGFFTFIAYALLYKKYMRRDVPVLTPFSMKRGLIICAIGAATCLAAAIGMQAIAQSIYW